ncbi:IS3 family transposase [Streptococcus ovuberis]|uniref:IS3 family transposase n=1 Tax=Streptococcus ovuberis TaxID=1936207 RepID=A0A7X6N2J6_9STRE|nr:IS3 family transposase [Streptococcus ovuberis]NKZ20979.1 IS3 family transposase [Streptococcus ovuberis]
MSRKIRRLFTDDFKHQIVDLYNAGMKRRALIKEYELTPSTFDKWVKQVKTTGSFKTVDNLTDEQQELIALRKRNKELEMQVDILKQAAVIMAPKREIITANKDKYSISAMCRWLNLPRSSYYYKASESVAEAALEEKVKQIFLESQSRYGARKIKKCLESEGIQLSHRRIRRIMKRLNLVSIYQKAAVKPQSKGKNDAPIPNRLARQFNQETPLEVLVTDLTYVRVGKRWAYVCLMIDLYNREIIGLLVGWQKTATLVKQAIQSIPYALTKVKLFHSDRGKEFDNQLIDDMLEAFGITRSLSQAGCPYDNAVAESTYRSFKLEFINQETFHSLEELTLKNKDYVHWWNHNRIHGSLNYQTPMAKRVIA